MKLTKSRKILLGFQHAIAMFGSTVLMPLLTGLNPSVALFAAGVGTLVFHFITKRIVPVFLGSSFAFIAPILIAKSAGYSLATATGAIIIVGIVYLVFAAFVLWLGYQRIKALFPAVVTGPIIIVIGLTLAPVAINMASQDWLLAAVSLISAIIAAVFFRGLFQMIPVVVGVFVGYILGLFSGAVKTQAIASAAWIGLPHFMMPQFNVSVMVLIVPVAIVSIMEHIGDILTNSRVVGKDFFRTPGLQRTLLGDGVATVFSGFVGGPTLTTYAENTGVLAVTRVYDPAILRIAAVFAICFGLSPKIAALLQSLPAGVLGGISILLFGMIASIGIRTLAESQIDFTHSRNLIIVSVILVLGLGGAHLKFNFPFHSGKLPLELSGMALAAITGIILNLVLPAKIEKESL